MAVSVVIPNYDGERLLPRCLDALRRQTAAPAEVIVVDDGSRDRSVALLRSDHPDVRLVVLRNNRGFAAAANAGLAAARSSEILLLNSDAIAEPALIATLQASADAHPDAGAFACCMLKDDGGETVDSAGLALAPGFLAISRGEHESPAALGGDAEVFGACGGAALYRRALLDEIGGFDEALGMVFEDVDLALRAQLAGARTRFVAAARVRHVGSATLGRHSARSVFLYCRNRLAVMRRGVPAALWRRERLRAAWVELKTVLLSARRGRLGSALAGEIATLDLAPIDASRVRPGAGERLARWLADGETWRLRSRRAREARA